MSVLTRTRFVILTLALTLSVQTIHAAPPSARSAARMAYEPATKTMVMFGGQTALDKGTGRTFNLGETWIWTGLRWVQRYPAVAPVARYAHNMVTDTIHQRIVLFGGRGDDGDLNDTWFYRDATWTQVNTPNAPSKRSFAGAAYDSRRDRVVLVGGIESTTTSTAVYDTWEFDGTTWVRRNATGPQINKPILSYDESRGEMIMLGELTDETVKMYRYDAAAGTWNELTPTTKPPCSNESMLTFRPTDNATLLTGGICSTSGLTDEVWSWNGTDWAKVTTLLATERVYSAAQAFDVYRSQLVRYGGTAAFDAPRPNTFIFTGEWSQMVDVSAPGARSLYALTADPVNKTIWMYGGINEGSSYFDFWQYRNGQWTFVNVEGTPESCSSPNSVFDTDRKKMVMVCQDTSVYEWDGAAWKKFTDLKTHPKVRRFSSMVYDQTMKKTVLFGGFDETNYLAETWLWDGAAWTEIKNKRPPARTLTAMWFDPVQKKTMIYGGVGRPTPDDGIERYSDMWSLDSTGWTKMTPATTPGTRYGAQVTVDPNKPRVLLFGGLLYEATPGEAITRKQTFQNDLWEWDGTTWKKLTTVGAPPARQNGAMVFDATRNEMVLFAGYGGSFFSDTWLLNNLTWSVREQNVNRRRTTVAGSVGVHQTVDTPELISE
jgi:hypothetical protein